MKTKLYVLLIFVLISNTCCTKPSTNSTTTPNISRSDATPTQRTFQQFDFGSVLVSDKLLRHEFTIDNPTEKPVRIVQSVAMMSCCSSIEKHPVEILPHSNVAIPVTLRPGKESVSRSVSFLVETDQPGRNIHILELVGKFISEWEVNIEKSSSQPIFIGGGGKLVFEITCRHEEKKELMFPDSITVTEPLQLTEDREFQTERLGNLVELKRSVVVSVPTMNQVGLHRGSLTFNWKNGDQRSHDFGWEVVPFITVAPSVLVIKSDEPSKDYTIVCTSQQQSFQITKPNNIEFLEAVSFPVDSNTVQKITLRINPSRIDLRDNAREIRFATNCPRQPEIFVKIVILGETSKGNM